MRIRTHLPRRALRLLVTTAIYRFCERSRSSSQFACGPLQLESPGPFSRADARPAARYLVRVVREFRRSLS